MMLIEYFSKFPLLGKISQSYEDWYENLAHKNDRVEFFKMRKNNNFGELIKKREPYYSVKIDYLKINKEINLFSSETSSVLLPLYVINGGKSSNKKKKNQIYIYS